MERERFDALARSISTKGSRRSALAVLLGATLLGPLATTDAAKRQDKKRNQKTRRRRSGNGQSKRKGKNRDGKQDRVGAEASCAKPGPSANLRSCDFRGQEFIEGDLSSSNMKNADFRGAILRCADLSSSQLAGAKFQNADLTRANLRSSGCKGAVFNAGTTFCRTIMCDGTVRNDDCPDPDVEPTCSGCDVCPDGCPFTSLADAVEAATPDSTIRVCAGTYPISASISRGLTIVGAGSGDDPNTDTILVGAVGGRRVLTVSGSSPVTLENLRIARGSVFGSDRGGGIENLGTLTLLGCTVTENTARDGAGINNMGTLTLGAGSRVAGNPATRDGGGIMVSGGTLTMQPGSRVEGNTAGRFGGGIWASGTLTLQSGSFVTRNSAAVAGGGIYDDLDAGTVSVADATIVTNNTVEGATNNCRPENVVPNCTG